MARPHDVESDDGGADASLLEECVPAVSSASVSSCSFSSWAPLFSKHTHRAECIDLPQVWVPACLS
jgi:hypothetical protein